MKRLFSFIALVLICSSAFGQVEIEKKKSLIGVTNPEIVSGRIFVGADSNPSVSDIALIKIDPAWKFSLIKLWKDGARVDPEKFGDSSFIVAGKGKYEVDATLFDPEKGIFNKEYAFELGGAAPGPDPPKPDPDPPTPDPSPAPIPVAGFRVLILEETADRPRLPPAQLSILFSPELRDLLNTKCVIGPDGRTPEWRIMDDDTEFPETCDLVWCKAIKRPHASLPWIIISDGVTGYEGPLPNNLADTLALIRKYAK